MNVILEVKNMLCFAENEWLDDACLGIYRAHLRYRNKQANRGNHTVHFFTPLFLTSLLRGGEYGFDRVKNWTRRSKVDIFAMAHVVVVVNEDGQHWVPVVIDMNAKTLTYLDSLATARANDAVPASAMETMGHLLQYLKDEHKAWHKTLLPDAWSRDNAM
jgi:Ulp1 family protease